MRHGMSAILDWLARNKEWVFSGFGVAVALTVWQIYVKFFGSKPAPPPIIVAPNINFSQQVALPSIPEKATSLPSDIKPKHGPQLYSLPPRICSVEDHEGGVREGGDTLYPRAVVATFRMKTPPSDDDEANITARLTYRTVDDLGFRQVSKEIHRVNYGMWLNEDFNFVSMGIADTKEVLLLVNHDGMCVALQDNRRSVARRDPASVFQFPSDLESMFVDVTLLDDMYGPIITYTYELKINPLRVFQIIRGG
jgi:hypothetical protein